MLKKTITYEDFEGEEVTRDFFFNMTRAEFLEFVSEMPGYDIEAYLTRLAESNDKAAMLKLLKDLIARSYGERKDDLFIKSPDITASFLSSEAYSELLFAMAENLDLAVGFFNGVMPKVWMKEISKEQIKEKAEELSASNSTNVSTPETEVLSAEQIRVQELEAELKRLKSE